METGPAVTHWTCLFCLFVFLKQYDLLLTTELRWSCISLHLAKWWGRPLFSAFWINGHYIKLKSLTACSLQTARLIFPEERLSLVHWTVWLQCRDTLQLPEDWRCSKSSWHRSNYRPQSHFHLCKEVRFHLSRQCQSPPENWCWRIEVDWQGGWQCHKLTAVCVLAVAAGSASVHPHSGDQ